MAVVVRARAVEAAGTMVAETGREMSVAVVAEGGRAVGYQGTAPTAGLVVVARGRRVPR